MSISEVNMMIRSNEDILLESAPYMGRPRKVLLPTREQPNQKMSRKPSVISNESPTIKKPREDSEKDEQSLPDTEMVAIWSDLQHGEKEESSGCGSELPYIDIAEQPDPDYRFRYGSEGNVVAPLHGEHSSKGEIMFPKIKLRNIDLKKYAKAEISVSCVTQDAVPRVHPYKVKNNKKKKGSNCSNGVCQVTVTNEDGTVSFDDIGIQRVKIEDTQTSLEERKCMKIDPFNQGYGYTHSQYDKEAVKLCFQATLIEQGGNVVILQPVTSHTIANTKGKAMSLHSVTPNTAYSDEPVKLALFAENLPKAGDILVVFSTPCGDIQVLPEYQHHNCALHVSTPLLNINITHKMKAEIKLFRISNNSVTDSLEFSFSPPKKSRPSILNKPSDTETSQSGKEFTLPFRNQNRLEGVLIPRQIEDIPEKIEDWDKIIETQSETQNPDGSNLDSTHSSTTIIDPFLNDEKTGEPTEETFEQIFCHEHSFDNLLGYDIIMNQNCPMNQNYPVLGVDEEDNCTATTSEFIYTWTDM